MVPSTFTCYSSHLILYGQNSTGILVMFRPKPENIAVPPRNPRRNRGVELSAIQELESAGFANPTDPIQQASSADNFGNDHSEAGGEIPIAYHTPREEIPLTPLDHVIGAHGGRTSSLDCLPAYMNGEKGTSPSPVEELLHLKRENSRLRAELAYFKKIRQVLMELFTRVIEVYQTCSGMQKLHQAWLKASEGLAVAERELLQYWGILVDSSRDGGQEQCFL